MKALLREPLVHFLLLGVVLFGAEHLLHPGPKDETIVVSSELENELFDAYTRANGHPPSEERKAALVSRWIDEEVLYREGKKRGLGQDDPRVRARIADKMGFVLSKKAVLPKPSKRSFGSGSRSIATNGRRPRRWTSSKSSFQGMTRRRGNARTRS